MGSVVIISQEEKMKHFIFLACLLAPVFSGPLLEDDRIFGWLFKPDCSRPVFAPFGLYNPCPDTTTTTTTTAAPTTTTTTTTTSTTATTTTTTPATCSSSSVCGDGSSGCVSGTTCYDGTNIINGNCCGQAANYCLIQSAMAGAGVAVACP